MNDRIRFCYDPDPDFSYLEQWDTPEKYAGNEAIAPDGRTVTDFDEYRQTYGNPEFYVAYGAIHERRCDMGGWHEVGSVWGCDILASEDPGVDGQAFAPTDVPEILQFTLEHFALETEEVSS